MIDEEEINNKSQEIEENSSKTEKEQEKTKEKDKKKLNGAKKMIDEYLIKDTIGKGTFSTVKLGEHITTKQKVAIKILNKEKIKANEDLVRIKREIKILSMMDHPNIIKTYKITENAKNYYIIMEYCDGGELFNYIVEKEKLEENEASMFFYQLINALEYIHSLGIAHRDLKPENLLLLDNKIIKLIDFGLSNYFNGEKNLETPCGSPSYASPEIIKGEAYNGFSIDIWASGIIMFAMLCGYLPFDDDDDEEEEKEERSHEDNKKDENNVLSSSEESSESDDNEILFQRILEGKLDFPDYLSKDAIDLMKKILVVDPEKRIQIKDIKKHKFYLLGQKYFLLNQKNIPRHIISNKIKTEKEKDKTNKENININIINNININNYSNKDINIENKINKKSSNQLINSDKKLNYIINNNIPIKEENKRKEVESKNNKIESTRNESKNNKIENIKHQRYQSFIKKEEKLFKDKFNKNKKEKDKLSYKFEDIDKFAIEYDEKLENRKYDQEQKSMELSEQWVKNREKLPKSNYQVPENEKLNKSSEEEKMKVEDMPSYKYGLNIRENFIPEIDIKKKREREAIIFSLEDPKNANKKYTLHKQKKNRILLKKRDNSKPSKFKWKLKLEENEAEKKEDAINQNLIRKPKKINLLPITRMSTQHPEKKPDYLQEIISKKEEKTRTISSKKIQDEHYEVNNINKKSKKWEKEINNKSGSLFENINNVQEKAKIIDQQADMKEKLLIVNGGIENNPELGRKVSNLLIDSIQAKINILKKMNQV